MFLLSFIFIALIIKSNLRIIFHIWSCYSEFQCWVSMLSSNQTSNQFLCNLQDAHHLQKHLSRLLESFFIFKLLVLSQSLSRIIWADCSNFSEVHFQFLLSLYSLQCPTKNQHASENPSAHIGCKSCDLVPDTQAWKKVNYVLHCQYYRIITRWWDLFVFSIHRHHGKHWDCLAYTLSLWIPTRN